MLRRWCGVRTARMSCAVLVLAVVAAGACAPGESSQLETGGARAASSCEATGDPCPDEGLHCTGTESCNDTTDSCEATGDPCPDDGLHCTGTESCNDTTDACEATGDPCASNVGDDDIDCSESCDDATAACEANDPQDSACTDGTSAGTCDDAGVCLFAQGQVCANASDCLSGFCAGGLCCDTACDAACETSNASGNEGTCGPAPTRVTCRAASGECDSAEACDGTGRDCPADVAMPDGTSGNGDDGTCTDGACEDNMGGGGRAPTGSGGAANGAGGGGTAVDPGPNVPIETT